MRAAVVRRFGPPDVLELEELATPTPRDDEVLIRTHATTVTAGDCEFRRMDFPRYLGVPLRIYTSLRNRNGTVLGQELAGVVESVGDDVTEFEPGDRVFAATLFRFGAYAEYVRLPETYPITAVPDGVSFEEAATLPVGGVNAMHFLEKGAVRAGDAVLINGAGGSIGTYAIQLAGRLDADVTAVDSGEKLAALRSIGADRVVDYTREDFTARGERYDVIVDVVGGSPFSRSVDCLEANGRYVLGNPSLEGRIRGLWTTATTDKRVAFELARPRPAALERLAGLVETRELRPVVDRRFRLDEIVAAHRYVESGRKTGNVVVTLD